MVLCLSAAGDSIWTGREWMSTLARQLDGRGSRARQRKPGSRLDARFDRDAGALVVRRVWWEPGVKTGAGRQAGLEAALARLARTVSAGSWSLS